MADHFKIVETDNFGGDYPNETALKLPYLTFEAATEIVDAINKHCNHDGHGSRYWTKAPIDYVLAPGFEP